LAFGSFLTAEHFGASGVLATVTAGLVVGNARLFAGGRPLLTSRGQEFVTGFWEFCAFLANSVVFLLIGANVAVMPYHQYGAWALAGAIGLTLLGRAAAVYPLCLLFRGSRNALSMIEQNILWWGGLRGALGLALALSVPKALPLRDEIVVLTFGVVAFSIVAQGLTMPLLLRRLKPSQPELPLDQA
jgi:CPA1 family monovalent cation:H+ antiporter